MKADREGEQEPSVQRWHSHGSAGIEATLSTGSQTQAGGDDPCMRGHSRRCSSRAAHNGGVNDGDAVGPSSLHKAVEDVSDIWLFQEGQGSRQQCPAPGNQRAGCPINGEATPLTPQLLY